MKVYDAASIRNVALVGHSGSGKTQLASAILADAGMINRFGKVDEGTTVTDLRRRGNRPQAHAVGEPRLRRVEQAEDQPDRHARRRQLPQPTRAPRCTSPTPRWSCRRRRRRRHGADREGVGARPTELGCRAWSSLNRLDRDRASLERSLASLREIVQTAR